jgi:hypothetical protein
MLARRSTFLTLSALAAVANARSLPDTMRLPCPMEQPDVVRAASCFFVTLRLSFLARRLGCATAVSRQLLSHSPSWGAGGGTAAYSGRCWLYLLRSTCILSTDHVL